MLRINIITKHKTIPDTRDILFDDNTIGNVNKKLKLSFLLHKYKLDGSNK